jgi:hypothetical protein
VTVSAQWKTSPAVPDNFRVEVFEQTVSFGALRLPITSRNLVGNEVVGIMAGDENITIAMEKGQGSWRWSLAGAPGFAVGYMTPGR